MKGAVKEPVKMLKKNLHAIIDAPRKTLRIFVLGAFLFVAGMGIIQWGNHFMNPSVEQEVAVLFGMIIAGAGFVTAIIAQIFLIVHRFKNMGQ